MGYAPIREAVTAGIEEAESEGDEPEGGIGEGVYQVWPERG